jgi:hypothetical protein
MKGFPRISRECNDAAIVVGSIRGGRFAKDSGRAKGSYPMATGS